MAGIISGQFAGVANPGGGSGGEGAPTDADYLLYSTGVPGALTNAVSLPDQMAASYPSGAPRVVASDPVQNNVRAAYQGSDCIDLGTLMGYLGNPTFLVDNNSGDGEGPSVANWLQLQLPNGPFNGFGGYYSIDGLIAPPLPAPSLFLVVVPAGCGNTGACNFSLTASNGGALPFVVWIDTVPILFGGKPLSGGEMFELVPYHLYWDGTNMHLLASTLVDAKITDPNTGANLGFDGGGNLDTIVPPNSISIVDSFGGLSTDGMGNISVGTALNGIQIESLTDSVVAVNSEAGNGTLNLTAYGTDTSSMTISCIGNSGSTNTIQIQAGGSASGGEITIEAGGSGSGGDIQINSNGGTVTVNSLQMNFFGGGNYYFPSGSTITLDGLPSAVLGTDSSGNVVDVSSTLIQTHISNGFGSTYSVPFIPSAVMVLTGAVVGGGGAVMLKGGGYTVSGSGPYTITITATIGSYGPSFNNSGIIAYG